MNYKDFGLELITEVKPDVTLEDLKGKVLVLTTNVLDIDVIYSHYSRLNTDGFTFYVTDSSMAITLLGVDEKIILDFMMYAVKSGYLKDTIGYDIRFKLLEDSYIELVTTAESRVNRVKTELINEVTNLQQSEFRLAQFKSKKDEIIKYKMDSNNCVYFEFKDVVAEDTDAVGDDIELGNLTFKANLVNCNIDIEDGTYSRDNCYNEKAYHPHQISDGICLGSQSGDAIECIKRLDLKVLEAILSKFAHSYTSSDSAGAKWKLWTDNCIEIDGDYYLEDEVRYSSHYGEYIQEEDACYVPYMDDYYYSDDVVFSNGSGEYILKDDAVEIRSGDWEHIDNTVLLENDYGYEHEDGDYAEIDGLYYSFDDPEIVSLAGSGEWILRENAIEYDGEWYTEEDLPEEAREAQD